MYFRFIYIFSLAAIVAASVLVEKPGVLQKVWQYPANTTAMAAGSGSGVDLMGTKSEINSTAMAAIMGFLMVKTAIYDVNREFLQYQFGPLDFYWRDRFNMARARLCSAFSGGSKNTKMKLQPCWL
jgi:hypothetical protein